MYYMEVQIAPCEGAFLGERTCRGMSDDTARALIGIFKPNLQIAGEMLSTGSRVRLGTHYPRRHTAFTGRKYGWCFEHP